MSGIGEAFWVKVERDSDELRGESEDSRGVSFSDRPNLNLFLNLSMAIWVEDVVVDYSGEH